MARTNDTRPQPPVETLPSPRCRTRWRPFVPSCRRTEPSRSFRSVTCSRPAPRALPATPGIGARRIDALVDIADQLLTHGYLDLGNYLGRPLPDHGLHDTASRPEQADDAPASGCDSKHTGGSDPNPAVDIAATSDLGRPTTGPRLQTSGRPTTALILKTLVIPIPNRATTTGYQTGMPTTCVMLLPPSLASRDVIPTSSLCLLVAVAGNNAGVMWWGTPSGDRVARLISR